MNYISEGRHMFVLPKNMKKKPSKERKKFDKELKELKKCATEVNNGDVLTIYNVEIIDE